MLIHYENIVFTIINIIYIKVVVCDSFPSHAHTFPFQKHESFSHPKIEKLRNIIVEHFEKHGSPPPPPPSVNPRN